MKYFIWDLDNCLADDSWRFKHIDWHLEGDDRWRRYNALSKGDPPHHQREFALTAMIGENVVFTNRDNSSREWTTEWLARHFFFHGKIAMRAPGLRIAPELAKEQMLNEMFSSGKKEVVAAFDDHPPILEMYRKHGIVAVQLRVHDIDVYGDRPKNLL